MSETETVPSTATVEHDGRVYTGADTASIEAALDRTSFGREPEPEKAEPAQPQPPKQTRGQKRFGELTEARDRALAEAAAAKEELAKVKAMPAPAAPVAEPAKPKVEAAKVEEKPFPNLDDFASEKDPIMAWQKAVAAYNREALEKEFDARLAKTLEAERASRRQTESLAEILERGKAAYPDFEQVVFGSTVNFPQPMIDAIAKLPNSEHVQYALCADPDLAQRIAKIDNPVTFGIEIGKLGSGPARVPPASRVKPALSVAPPPIQPVTGASRTATPSLEELAAKPNGYDDYKAQRHAAMGGKHR